MIGYALYWFIHRQKIQKDDHYVLSRVFASLAVCNVVQQYKVFLCHLTTVVFVLCGPIHKMVLSQKCVLMIMLFPFESYTSIMLL